MYQSSLKWAKTCKNKCIVCMEHLLNVRCPVYYWLKVFTKEVVENLFTESPVDFHEVGQTIKILSARDPVRFFCFFGLLTRIVKAKEAALFGNTDTEGSQLSKQIY